VRDERLKLCDREEQDADDVSLAPLAQTSKPLLGSEVVVHAVKDGVRPTDRGRMHGGEEPLQKRSPSDQADEEREHGSLQLEHRGRHTLEIRFDGVGAGTRTGVAEGAHERGHACDESLEHQRVLVLEVVVENTVRDARLARDPARRQLLEPALSEQPLRHLDEVVSKGTVVGLADQDPSTTWRHYERALMNTRS
jgi:hypothetical protein